MRTEGSSGGVPPWLQGPYDLLEHALEMATRPDTDKNRRIALLAIDNSLEITIKTFLSLSKRRGGLGISRNAVQKLNFHALFDALREHGSNYLEGLDEEVIRYYHEQRNELYHSETGQTARRTDVDHYIVIAQTLFTALFGLAGPRISRTEPGVGSLLLTPGELAEREQELLTRLRLVARRRRGADAPMSSTAWGELAQRLAFHRWAPTKGDRLLVEEVESFLRAAAEADAEPGQATEKDHSGSNLLSEFLELEHSLGALRDRVEGHITRFELGLVSLAERLANVIPDEVVFEIRELAPVRNALAHGRLVDVSPETAKRVHRLRRAVDDVRMALTDDEAWAWRERHGLPQPGDLDHT